MRCVPRFEDYFGCRLQARVLRAVSTSKHRLSECMAGISGRQDCNGKAGRQQHSAGEELTLTNLVYSSGFWV